MKKMYAGFLLTLAFTMLAAMVGKMSDAAVPTPLQTAVPRYVYVPNGAQASISTFSIDAATGVVAPAGPIVCTGNTVLKPPCNDGATPFSAAAHPSGKFLYVANYTLNNILIFAIDAATGTLTRRGSVCTTTGPPACNKTHPVAIYVEPTGKFVYVVNRDSASISAFQVNPTSGMLSPVAGSPFPTGKNPLALAWERSGKFAYVVNAKDNSISAYIVNSTTGALQPSHTTSVGKTPVSLAASPAADFLYVLNTGDNNISTYAVNPQDGTLQKKGDSVCSRIKTGVQCASTKPAWLAIDPVGKFLYVANEHINFLSGGISAFSISVDGTLTRLPAASFNLSQFPHAMKFDPSGRFLYVLSQGTNSLLAFSLDSTSGVLTSVMTGPAITGALPNSLEVVGY